MGCSNCRPNGLSENDRLATDYRKWLKDQLEPGVDLVAS